MRADALAQVATLADVERQRVQSVEQIDAGRLRQRIERVGGELRRQARGFEHALCGLGDRVGREIAVERLHERPQDARVAKRAMAMPSTGQRVALDHAIEVVPRRRRETAAATA